MIKNNEGDRCAKCEGGKGEIPISTEESTFWVCEMCESEMFEVNTTLIIQEIDTQIKHHKKEGNKSAINSLKYIREMLR